MSLTDPELDLLQELLSDDPTDDVFLQVGEELNRRTQFEAAAETLRKGLKAHPGEADGWRQLARAALECAAYDEALRAWDKAGPAHQADPDFARLQILAFERSGKIEEARQAVERFEQTFDGFDVVVEAAKERMDAPPAANTLSANDPFLTVGLAERYASLGREDRAIRVYRRILFKHPDDIAIRARLEQLDGHQTNLDDFTDLSEELADPNLVPPLLDMPMPGITSASVKPAPARDALPAAGAVPGAQRPPLVLDEDNAGPTYTAPSHADDTPTEKWAQEDVPTQIDLPPPLTTLPKKKPRPAALEKFMADSRDAARRVANEAAEDDEELEELPGLAEVMSPKRRKKRRSLLKR